MIITNSTAPNSFVITSLFKHHPSAPPVTTRRIHFDTWTGALHKRCNL